ncbi:MAG: UbiX family flavin prenyltransferase [Bacteroidales bacterium]|nr:UbiX family flavin prenyltransferase [Bacteroidales bacterium]
MSEKQKIIVAVSGASGAIYADLLLQKLNELSEQIDEVSVVFSKNGKEIWEHELNNSDYNRYQFKIYENSDFYAPMASGSSIYHSMIVCPCSMGTLGKIATGISSDLISRAAEVTLKQRRKLILVTRETPFSLISIKNMETITLAGGIICDANPSFYNNPKNINEVVLSVVERIIDLIGLKAEKSFRWGNPKL